MPWFQGAGRNGIPRGHHVAGGCRRDPEGVSLGHRRRSDAAENRHVVERGRQPVSVPAPAKAMKGVLSLGRNLAGDSKAANHPGNAVQAQREAIDKGADAVNDAGGLICPVRPGIPISKSQIKKGDWRPGVNRIQAVSA